MVLKLNITCITCILQINRWRFFTLFHEVGQAVCIEMAISVYK